MSLQTQLAALVTAIGADIKALYAGKVDKTTITAAGAALLDDADAAAQRTTLGLGTAAITNTGTGATNTILGNDTRLSDAREWSEATVEQAEAEAGTATARRAWTAERVKQASAAWWSGAKSSLVGPVRITSTGTGNSITATSASQATTTDASLATVFVKNVGGTPADGALAAAVAFGRVNSDRAGALVAASQDTADGDQIGLKFYTRTSTATSNNTLNAAPALHLRHDNTIVTQGQINFPATQNTSVDANTLDDYEEGTWTPAYSPPSGAFGSVTYSLQFGKYTKVGRLVTVTFLLRTSAFDLGTGTGGLRISGLPFTSNGTNAGVGLGACLGFNTNNPTGVVNIGSTTYMELWHRTTASGGTVATTVAELSTGASNNYVCGSLSYEST